MPKQIELTKEERGELVLRLIREEATAANLAREASVSEQTIYQWRDNFLHGAVAGLEDKDDLETERRRHARELARRDQLIGELTVANRVLKKNLGISE